MTSGRSSAGTTAFAGDAGPSLDELLSAPLADLLAAAARRRDEAWGRRVTYSPKVFIPLTQLCRDRCGYCTFAQPPARLDSPYLTPEAVLDLARKGEAAGCHEALFTLGERPEERYPAARSWLGRHGHDSTLQYLAEMCTLVLEETGLLPHANAGALELSELRALRATCVSQGMMLESVDAGLACHHGSPDKTPDRRLATLHSAGEAQIPFTTGILVGIGDDRPTRLAALRAIADAHLQFGHVQEVIVQNFRPKPGTAMQNTPAPAPEEYLWTIAAARLVLPLDIHLQAPPNLSEDFGSLLDAGIDDWGGVSPVTPDHVNPEAPWPALVQLKETTERRGRVLAPRLTVYPTYALDPDRWIDPSLHRHVLAASDAEGLGRDSLWWAGGQGSPPRLLPAPPAAGGAVGEVLAGVADGATVGEDEIVTLFSARGPEVAAVAEVADALRREAVGATVTWVANRNINYTNVCTYRCRFCAFSKGPLSLNLRGQPYLLSFQEIQRRVVEAVAAGATEVCLQGGIHPSFDGNYYVDVCRAVKEVAPHLHLHGFTALEVTEGARRLDEPLGQYLQRLMDAGLRTLPGTAAEILDDDVRATLCPDKITTDEWLHAHRTAHTVGLRSNITIMFGAVEAPRAWARHLLRTRALQEETGGFTEFVPLPFVHMATPLWLQGRSRRGPTFREALLMHAVARIAYRGLIDNIQVSWVKLGAEGARQALRAGANDLGGTLMDENISRAAGAAHGQRMHREDFEALVQPLGRPLAQRTTLYQEVGSPA